MSPQSLSADNLDALQGGGTVPEVSSTHLSFSKLSILR
jgi:hypothetical protein